MFTAQCSKCVKTKIDFSDQNQLYLTTRVLKNVQYEHYCKNGELSNYTERTVGELKDLTNRTFME